MFFYIYFILLFSHFGYYLNKRLLAYAGSPPVHSRSLTNIADNLQHELIYKIMASFCRAMLCISAAIAVMRCPSVCLSVRLSVTFVDHVKTNKHIFEIFSPSGRHTILVFPYQTGWRYSHGTPLTGASNAGGVWAEIAILIY